MFQVVAHDPDDPRSENGRLVYTLFDSFRKFRIGNSEKPPVLQFNQFFGLVCLFWAHLSLRFLVRFMLVSSRVAGV